MVCMHPRHAEAHRCVRQQCICTHQVPEPEREEEAEDMEEDPKDDPVEAPQAAGIEEEENAAEEGVCVEDDFADYWALVRSDSENSVENDYCFAGNTALAVSFVGSCIGPPSAGN
ncbi:hypothetical protein PIB30_087223 [Stylosanthes scabra]|uniref:Uncharacterized protein n=1 Tax=Stylosanthes scabra TaxID=79078 RepID=A0ABU6TVP5_9FABA|nr:hypothetical protein [Stylosanthes scabra]